MIDPIVLDHIEVHVTDIVRYGDFLPRLFGEGRFNQISDSGTDETGVALLEDWAR